MLIHTIPAAVARETAGRSHYTFGQDGWEEVADHALDRAEQHADAATPQKVR